MKLNTKIIFTVIPIYIITNIIFTFFYTSGLKNDSLMKLDKKIENISLLLNQVNAGPLYDIDIIKIETNLKSFLNTPEILYISLKEIGDNIDIEVGDINSGKEKNIIKKITNVTYNNDKIGEITTYFTTKLIEEEAKDSFIQIIMYSFIATFIVSIALYILIQKLLSPISRLTNLTSEITSGNLEKQIDIVTNDEIGELTKQFEKMRTALKDRIYTINTQNKKIKSFNEELEKEILERTKELLKQKNMFETLVNSIPDIVWMKDTNGIYLHCNQRFTKFFGASQQEIIGKTDYDFVDKELADFFRMHDNNAINSEIPLINYETIPFASDGHEEYTQTIKTAVKNEDNNILGILGIGRDFTKEQAQKEELETAIHNLKVTQNKLIEAEKMSSLGVLVSGIAHEINTPIGIGLTGSTHFIEITNKLNDDYKNENMSQEDFEEYLATAKEISELINTNLHRTAQLVKNFKKISFDQSSEEKREINLKSYIDEVLFSMKSIIKKTNLKIENNCNDNINIYSYPGGISQIITNLIINSIKHGFEEKEKGNIYITANIQEQVIELIYKDDGKGIDKDILPKIFDPFFTTNREKGGTGLGLNILYNIISNTLNGTIRCNSEKDKGVEFIILFQENKEDDKVERETLWQI